MTTKTVVDDQRYSWPNINPGLSNLNAGRHYAKYQVGQNWQPGQPAWQPHNYTMTLGDTGTGVRRYDPAPPYFSGEDGPINITCRMIREWTPADTAKLYGRLGDKYDDGAFNTPVFVGELGETTDMLAGRLRHLAAVGMAVKKGNLKKAAKLLNVGTRRARGSDAPKIPLSRKDKPFLQGSQTVTSAWLEMQYGWTPLLGDISDLADHISKLDTPRSKRLFASHSIRKEPYPKNSAYSDQLEGKGKHTRSIIAYVEEVFPPLSERLGLVDPASVAWELLPFSFVADWAWPIGAYLKARSIAKRAVGTFVFTTYDRHRVRCTSTKQEQYSQGMRYAHVVLPAWEIYAHVNRTVSSSIPTLPLPPFNNPFGGEGPGDRLMSAFSLVREIFGGKTSRLV